MECQRPQRPQHSIFFVVTTPLGNHSTMRRYGQYLAKVSSVPCEGTMSTLRRHRQYQRMVNIWYN